MGPSHSSEAIILRSRPYGESDKIVTFLSLDFGKLTGIAKGAKNSRRRFANCLDPLTVVRVHFRTRLGAGLVFMESCDLLVSSSPLAEPSKLAYGSYLLELVDQLVEESHPVPETFRLLREAIHELALGPATATFLRVFELQLLQHSGYAPPLGACVRCDQTLGVDSSSYYDPMHHTFVCQACRSSNERFIEFAGLTLSTLHEIQTLPLGNARAHRMSRETATQSAQLLGYLMSPHLPRPLRSVQMIASLREANRGA